MSVVVEADVKPWRYPPGQEFLYGEWLRDIYEQLKRLQLSRR